MSGISDLRRGPEKQEEGISEDISAELGDESLLQDQQF